MTLYERKIKKIHATLYANQEQIDSIISVRKYIDTHYNTDLNLDTLSHNQCISKYHLVRLFKRYYGRTPRQYLIDIRIKKSKEHLLNDMSVTETCYAVGFESIGSFSKLFKTKTGKSPSQFRKEQLSRNKIETKF